MVFIEVSLQLFGRQSGRPITHHLDQTVGSSSFADTLYCPGANGTARRWRGSTVEPRQPAGKKLIIGGKSLQPFALRLTLLTQCCQRFLLLHEHNRRSTYK